MSRKWLFLGSFIIFLAAMAVLESLTASPAQAQCGDIPADSSCITCHETQGADPVYGKGEWHAIHARKDCCTNCHGGNCAAIDKDLAHENLIENPLTDIYTGCHSCHPDDYADRAARFAVVLAVTPGSISTPTAVPTRQVMEHPMVILPATGPADASGQPWILLLDAVMFTCLIFPAIIGLLFYLRKHNISYQ
jgi:hypothetical protein